MKKNRFSASGFNSCYLNKLLLIMKLTTFFLLVSLVSIAATGYSQSEKVTVQMQNAKLKDFFRTIEQQTDYKFLYRDDVVENILVTIDESDKPLDDVLNQVLDGSDFSFKVMPNNLIVIAPLTILQQLTVTGTIYDENGNPLPGVNIQIEGTMIGAISDANGKYSISIPNEIAILNFSFIGYDSRKVSVDGRNLIDVTLVPSLSSLEEVVVIGYGTQKKRDLTGAVASISTEEISQISTSNAIEAMQGQLAGVQIISSSGAPGDDAFLRIRGLSTFDGGVNPLYVVDGQPMENIQSINPSDISSIEILKDGASAAIYGSKSANGVVIITTKSGKQDESQINIDYVRSYNTARIMPVNTTNGRLKYEKFHNIIGDRPDMDTLNQQFYNNNNFQDLMYRTAVKDQVNLGISAGTKNTKIYSNTSFLNEEGVINKTNYMRLNTRLNIEQSFKNKIILGMRTSVSYDEQKNIDQNFESSLIGVLLTKAPFSTLYDIDGSYLMLNDSYRGRHNPLYEYSAMDAKRSNLRGNVFNYVEVKVLEDLKIRGNFGVDYNYLRNSQYFPPYVRSAGNTIRSSFNSYIDWNWLAETYVSYDKTLGNHKISSIAGFSAQRWGRPEEQISGLLASTLLPTLNNASEILITDTYTLDEDSHSLASFFTRFSYDYKSKYLLSFTVRADGSSRFGPENRWGYFPSLSGAWRFSEESFMDNLEFINDAKFRVSFAKTGNERIGNQDYDVVLTTGNFYNGINGVGLSTRLANPAIKWEGTDQSNIGLDLSILKGKVSITTDFYRKDTYDLLANQPLSAETGLENVRVNLGDIRNQGFEFSIQLIPIDKPDLIWKTNFNFSINNNEVRELAGGIPIISTNHITQEGSPLGSFYGYRILGVFAYNESNAFNPEGKQLTPNFSEEGIFTNYTLDGTIYTGEIKRIKVSNITSQGGDFYWKDNTGDFNIDGSDREIIGNPYPRYFGGFRNDITYKRFTFSILFDYQFDVQVYNAFMQNLSQMVDNAPTPPPFVLDNLWEGPGDYTALFPGGTRRVQNQLGKGSPTSNWVEDANFIKLRNIKISYDLPIKTPISIYASITNALVWTKYMGFDPEVTNTSSSLGSGVDDARYPRGREFLFGLKVTL